LKETRNTEEKREPVVMMTPGSFARMIETLRKTFDSAGLSMIYLMGRDVGAFEAREELKGMERSSDECIERQLVEKTLRKTREHGWGEMEVTQFDVLNGLVAISFRHHPFESICHIPDSEYCFFYRGYMAGVVSEVTGWEMVYSDLKCPHLGDDHCEIQLSRAR